MLNELRIYVTKWLDWYYDVDYPAVEVLKECELMGYKPLYRRFPTLQSYLDEIHQLPVNCLFPADYNKLPEDILRAGIIKPKQIKDTFRLSWEYPVSSKYHIHKTKLE